MVIICLIHLSRCQYSHFGYKSPKNYIQLAIKVQKESSFRGGGPRILFYEHPMQMLHLIKILIHIYCRSL